MRAVLLALLVSLPAWAERRAELPQGALVTDRAELAIAADHADPLARNWIALAEKGSFGALLRQLDQVPPSLETELALAGLVKHLQDAPAGRSKGAAGLLQALAGRPPRVWIRHEETRGDWFVPALDPGADAASALWLVARERARLDWVARLEAKGGAALERGLADGGTAAAAAEALALVTPAAIERVLAWKRTSAARLPGVVLLALAERARTPSLYAEALPVLDPARKVAVVAGLPDRLDTADAALLLQELAGEPDVGSAAVLALGRFAGRPEVRSWLLKALEDPEAGPSAAAALARYGGVDVVSQLQARAKQGAPDAAWAHVALALRLHASAEAQRALEALARNPDLPAVLREELQP